MQEEKPTTHPEQISHEIYKRTDKANADACAWAFTSATHYEPYYYKHPALGQKEVRARILYASLCHSDVLTVRGLWGPCTYPLAPGHEVLGEVTAVGSDVTTVKPGDKVMFGPLRDSCGQCQFCKEGLTNLCYQLEGAEKYLYGRYWGGYSTHIQQPESHCFKVPDGLDLRIAAPLMCSGVTVFRPLSHHCKKGDRIAVIGTGGLGHLAVQFASKMGMTVDAFTQSSDPEKEKLLKAHGADKVVNWSDNKNLKALAFQYDVLIDTIPVGVTCEKMDLLIGTLKPRGKMVLLSGPPDEQKFIASYFPCIVNAIEIIGSAIGGRVDTENMLKFAMQHKIDPICEFYDFWELPKAFDRLENGLPKFKCVLCIDEESKKYK